MDQPDSTAAWRYAIDEVLAGQRTDARRGLSADEVRKRLAEFGFVVPSTAAQGPAADAPPRLTAKELAQIVELHSGGPYDWPSSVDCPTSLPRAE